VCEGELFGKLRARMLADDDGNVEHASDGENWSSISCRVARTSDGRVRSL
jgi:hypothetical protein